ncbi:hypothetical protein BJX76DRAFT_369238 [Aspergillus varians]
MSTSASGAEIIGYAVPWVVSPGETVEVKVSSTEKSYSHRLVRLIQGYKHPRGPPVREEEIAQVEVEQHNDGRYKSAAIGSYALVDDWRDISHKDSDGLEIQFHMQPYLLDVDYSQVVLSCLDMNTHTGLAIVLKNSRLQFWLGTGDTVHVIQSEFPVARWRWLQVKATLIGGKFSSRIEQCVRVAEPTPPPEEIHQDQTVVLGSNPLLFAAGMFAGLEEESSKPSLFFNGRLDSPSLTSIRPGHPLDRWKLAQFDFSKAMSTDTIIDVSGFNRHGVLFNAPTRAVKGYDWDGTETDWTKASYGYGAIHFHEDDLDDAGWDTDFTVTVPTSARSGAYAVEVKTQDGTRDMVTFFVRPGPGPSDAKLAFVLSTFTYEAYANEHLYDRARPSAMIFPEGQLIVRPDNYDFNKMVKRSDLGLSIYDTHKDGSGTTFTSSRRPVLNIRPGYNNWMMDRPREFSADLLMIGFLEDLGIPYEVITDHCLHEKGSNAASQYSVLITGSHPEYPSIESQNAYRDFIKSGGSVLYLGGNGFYWSSETDLARPHRLEVRKGDTGTRTIELPAGERHHSYSGRAGGLWRSRGRAPNYLFGVGSCTFGIGKGQPYMPNIKYQKDPKYSWIFEGLEPGALIGIDGFGGGASGDELDRLDYKLGTPENTVILATSLRHNDQFSLFIEEQGGQPITDILGSNCDRVRSDITYYETFGGGGVFSVGSINWFCSLAWDNYKNSVATMTANVINEFLRRDRRSTRA